MRIAALLMLLACSPSLQAATPTPAEEVIRQLLAEGSVNCDLSVIPPAQKDAVIMRLRETARMRGGYSLLGTTVLDPMDADLLLLRIGDIFTIERMTQDYRAYDSMASWDYATRSFRYSRQPKIIPYLAEDFNAKEDPNKRITVKPRPDSGEFAVGVPARSIFSGVIVTDIIKSSPLFSPQMKAWASQAFALRLESPERFRKLMGVWWEANKAAFERGNYQAVMPVAEQDAVPITPPASTPKLENPLPQPAPRATPGLMPTLAQTPAAPLERRAPVWLWLVGILVLVAIVAFALKRPA
jgi:hypothetical protein